MFSVDSALSLSELAPSQTWRPGQEIPPTHNLFYFSTMHYFNFKFMLILKASLFAKSESECIFGMTSRLTEDETKQKFSSENNDIKHFNN